MDLGIAGRRAAVAAASKGLGLGCARALVAEGVRVAICGRDVEALEAARAELGDDTVALRADLSTPEGAAAFVAEAEAALGPLDILIPNAGGPPPGTFASTDVEAYRSGLDLSFLSTVAMCRAAVPGMAQRGWGRVVAITSRGARAPIPVLMASSAARAAVTSFLKVMAGEVAGKGVTVNSIQPGIHLTDRVRGMGSPEQLAASVPTGTIGDPDDFGRAVAFLCSESARFITGTSLLVDGGDYPGLV